MAKIILKRGTKGALPEASMAEGEPGYCTDTHQLFIGGPNNSKTLVGRVAIGDGSDPDMNHYRDEGAIYYAEGLDTLFVYDGGQWKDVKGIKIVDTGTSTKTVWSSHKTDEEIKKAITGLDWQQDVLAPRNPTQAAPINPQVGDRYMFDHNTGAVHSSWAPISGNNHQFDLVERTSGGWSVTWSHTKEKAKGAMCWMDSTAAFYYFDTSWNKFGGMQAINAGQGLTKNATTNTLNVGQGSGMQINADDISVKLDPTGPVRVATASNGLNLNLDPQSLEVQSTRLQAHLNENGCITRSSSGLSVNVNTTGGLMRSSNRLMIDLIANTPLRLVTGGLTFQLDASTFNAIGGILHLHTVDGGNF
jgi:hypothetical protein